MDLPGEPQGESGCSHMEGMGNCSGDEQGTAAGANVQRLEVAWAGQIGQESCAR